MWPWMSWFYVLYIVLLPNWRLQIALAVVGTTAARWSGSLVTSVEMGDAPGHSHCRPDIDIQLQIDRSP